MRPALPDSRASQYSAAGGTGTPAACAARAACRIVCPRSTVKSTGACSAIGRWASHPARMQDNATTSRSSASRRWRTVFIGAGEGSGRRARWRDAAVRIILHRCFPSFRSAMTQPWNAFLAQEGAELTDFAVRFADTPADISGCNVVPLRHLAHIASRGEDSTEFLHNLLSNDVRHMADDGIAWNSFNSPKGRMLASLLVHRDL